jgi:hypothetical protein
MALTLHGTVSDNTVVFSRPNAKPIVYNGDMAISQRGTSFASLSSGANNVLDRFAFLINEGTFTVTQDTSTPTGYGFAKSLKIDCTTADTSISSDGFVQLYQRFEGQDLQLLKKGTSSAEYITFSFWVKSNLTGNFVVEVKDHDNSRVICSLVNISSADTWEKKVLSFAGDTTGALTNDNNLSLQITMWLAAGSDYNSGTLATSWEAQNNVDRAVGTFNIASSTDNNFYTTGWQMEVGQFDTNSIPDFQFEDAGTSLARCQRYFQILNHDADILYINAMGSTGTTASSSTTLPYMTQMRTDPTTSISYSNLSSTSVALSETEIKLLGNASSTDAPTITQQIKLDAEL